MIPDRELLIDTLALQEAKASSELENIVTTQDELFQSDIFPDDLKSPAAKKVTLYRDALRLGYARLSDSDGVILNSTLIDMFRLLKDGSDDFRLTPGTALNNDQTSALLWRRPKMRERSSAT